MPLHALWRAAPRSPLSQPRAVAACADTYSGLKELYSRLTGGLSLKATLLIGYVSDWSHLALTMPAEQIAVRMQTKQSGSVLDALSAIVAEKGVLGLYRGIAAYVVLGLKPAIQLTVFEALKKRVLARATGSAASGLSAAQAFAIGAIARAVATVLVFPCTRAKVLMMTSAAASAQAEGGTHGGGPGTQPSAPARTSVLQLLLQSVRDEGPLSLYQGIKPELVRGVLSSAVMLMAKEKIAAANRSAIEALLRPAPSAQHRVGAATPSTPRAPAGPRSSSSAI